MKANYFLKPLAALLLMFPVTNALATVFPVNSDASFATALEAAVSGDKLVISGDITLSKTYTIDKNISIVADKEYDDEPYSGSFFGNGNKLFVVNPPAGEEFRVVFRNIGFYDGDSQGAGDDFDGGAMRILSGHTEFQYCEFRDNYTDNDAGAVNVAGDETYVKFFDCSFTNNRSDKRGGAFYIQGASTTVFEYCTIKGNSSVSDRGGAFFIDNNATVSMFYSLIGNNISGWVSKNLDADLPAEDLNPYEGGHGGGGFTINGNVALTLDACSVTGNLSVRPGSHGSAFFCMGKEGNVTLINSIVSKNHNRGAGSMFLATDGGFTVTLVNSDYIDNHAYDNAGNSSTIRLMNVGTNLNIFNSILIGNTITQPGGATDLCINGAAGIEEGLVIKNSIVGLVNGSYLPNDRVQPRIFDNASIANKSKVNYYNLSGIDASQPDWMILDYDDPNGSGVETVEGIQLTKQRRMSYYTLKDANAYSAKLGDPALLENYGETDADFTGKARTISGGAIAAGMLQGVYGPKILNDPVPDDPGNPNDNITGIKSVSAVAQDIRVIGTVSNGILGVDFGTLRGQAKGELISANGQIVENVFNTVVIGKGYYNVHAAPGFYILKVTVGDQTYAKRLIVK